jgi:hypothetical protein
MCRRGRGVLTGRERGVEAVISFGYDWKAVERHRWTRALYPAIASACPCIRHQFRLLRCVSQAPGWGRATGEACRGIFGESSCPPSCKLQRPCCIPELTLELLTERLLFDPTTLTSQLTSKPTMKGIQIKEYVKVHVPSTRLQTAH